MEILLRYLHFVSIFVIAGALLAEAFMLKATMTRHELRKILWIDSAYGMAALTVLAAGLTLWLGGFGKPADFYTGNWVFHAKLSLFLILGLLSVYPTRFFLRHRHGADTDVIEIPRRLVMLVRMELAFLLAIPFLATLMARGIGY